MKCETMESKISISMQESHIKFALLYKELLVLNLSTTNISFTLLTASAGTH